ncbi:PfkB family carbohydrate kinase [uncultured Ferrimonas sp.]|uniref:PfkB family carbohydrate kinase n=1 Tax=uncultured Ferrimonas sp. TaxID=432640 RepID=UPI002630E566|nr:PfkB family carbohydrate kinase [uncultured Ferrimonas sp.]
MAHALIIANINCDQILRLSRPLQSGARIHYEEQGYRLGGGAANTGLGLVWAGHQISLLSQVGEDQRGDWLIDQAQQLGFNCHWVHRHVGATQPLQLLMEPNGERTILRPNRPRLLLPQHFDPTPFNALYVNLSAEGLPSLMRQAMATDCLVVAQLPKDLAQRPCDYLITSVDDLAQHQVDDPWQFGQQIAGNNLRAFIVTQGSKGAIAYHADGQQSCPAVATNVIDSTGAGDCYAGGLIHALLQSLSLAEAMQQAAQWAAFAVSGDSSLPPETLQHYLQRR